MKTTADLVLLVVHVALLCRVLSGPSAVLGGSGFRGRLWGHGSEEGFSSEEGSGDAPELIVLFLGEGSPPLQNSKRTSGFWVGGWWVVGFSFFVGRVGCTRPFAAPQQSKPGEVDSGWV